MRRIAAGALVVLAVQASSPGDDRVHLVDGTTIEGYVETDGDAEVVVLVGAERRTIPRAAVRGVALDPGLHPAPRATAKPDTPATPPSPVTPSGVKSAAPGPDPPSAGAAPEPVRPIRTAPSTTPVKPADGATPPRAEPAPDPLDEEAVRAVASESNERRAKALDAIVSALPRSIATFDALVAHTHPSVRTAAAASLVAGTHPDPAGVLAKLIPDVSPAVRRAAIRAVRTLRLVQFETELIRRMQYDADRAVRLEAVRTLEDVGSVRCLDAVIGSWSTERDAAYRPRYLRVLRRITGEWAGDDESAWREAAERARRRSEVRPAVASPESG